MKRFLVITISGLLAGACSRGPSPKYFEGHIRYKSEYILKTDEYTSAYMDSAFHKIHDMYVKDGNIYEVYDRGSMLEHIFRMDDRKNYLKGNESDTVRWFDCAQPPRKINDYSMNKSNVIIHGIRCDEYVVHYDNRTDTYYFNSDTLKFNPAWYAKCTYANANLNIERMKAAALKHTVEFPDFIFISTIESFEYRTINPAIFDIKPRAILVEDLMGR